MADAGLSSDPRGVQKGCVSRAYAKPPELHGGMRSDWCSTASGINLFDELIRKKTRILILRG